MKKILSIILVTALVLSSLTVSAAAESSDRITGTIYGDQFYYTDSFFSGDASVYDPSLATMSLLMTSAGIADGSDDWTHQYDGLFRTFHTLGFTDAAVNDDFEKKPTMDSMGVGVAHKTITVNGQRYTLLVVVPRMNYMAEWASNFTIGATGEAAGFSSSAKIVEEFLSDYAARYSSHFEGELKLWVVGYSRGAAIANLVAGHITAAGKVGTIPVARENVYGYTFETPKGASTSVVSRAEAKSYTNIHNVFASNDLVTKLAPEEWGFLRYGTDESIIPEIRTAENRDLFETALTYLPEYLAGYTEEGQRVFASELFQAKSFSWTAEDHRINSSKSMSEFLNDLFKAASTGIGSRVSYTLLVQDTLRLIMSETEGGGYQTEAWTKAKAVLKTKLQDNVDEMIALAITGKESELEELLTNILNETVTGSGLDSKAYSVLPGQIVSLVPILVNTIMADVLIDNGSDILTLVDNLDILFNPHYTSQVYSWLRAQDVNYTPSAGMAVKPVVVSDVKVNVKKVTATKKVLLSKITLTRYETEIIPVTDGSIRKVEYRKLLIGRMTEGTSFTQSLKPTYLYIDVTDANGNVTHWEYENGKVSQVNQ